MKLAANLLLPVARRISRDLSRWLCRRTYVGIVVLVLSVLASSQVLAQEQTESSQQPDLAEIEQMVRNLGADTFAMRQEATRDLIRAGIRAIDPLLVAIDSGEPESQMRAIRVVGSLALDRDPECQRRAQDLLARLSSSENSDVRLLASQSINELGDAMVIRAVTELKSLGALIDSNQYSDGRQTISSYTVTIGPEFRGQPQDFRMLTWLKGQIALTLIGEKIDNSVISHLDSIKGMTSLIIKRGTLDNSALKTIAEFDDLTTLYFYYVGIDDQGMEDLVKMTKLTELRLFGTRVTEKRANEAQTEMTTTNVDRRNGAFLGIYFNDTDGPCVVNNIVQGSSAEKSGFQQDDQVLKFADIKIETGSQFLLEVAKFSPGDKVKAMVKRGEEEVTLELELGRFPDIEEFVDQ